MNMKRNLKDLAFDELAEVIKKLGEPPFRARQIFRWMYKKQICEIGEMSNLPKSLRENLSKEYCASGLELADKKLSEDGTIKYLFRLSDGQAVESVYIPDEKRGTVCVSTQAGCMFACAFCATGLQKFARNLSMGEIVNQVITVQKDRGAATVTHLVIMGMGEPLDNFDATVGAVRIFNSENGLGIGKRRITLSTAGVIPKIYRLGELALDINLAVSLHSADDEVRSRLMPINKKYPVSGLMKALREFPLKPQRKITIEILLFEGVNDSPNDAKKLIRALHGIKAKVNLIRFNPVHSCSLLPSPDDRLKIFKERLENAEIVVTTRKSRGGDIQAACGQLKTTAG